MAGVAGGTVGPTTGYAVSHSVGAVAHGVGGIGWHRVGGPGREQLVAIRQHAPLGLGPVLLGELAQRVELVGGRHLSQQAGNKGLSLLCPLVVAVIWLERLA